MMMKVLFLLALVPLIVLAEEGQSACRQCGGACQEKCDDNQYEPAELKSPCKADKNLCCIPKSEFGCYKRGVDGACLTKSYCEKEGGEAIESGNCLCNTVRENPRICCQTPFIRSATGICRPQNPPK